MSYYFADTSAIAKRYINEQGSTWMRSLADAASKHIIIVSDLAIVEFHSLLARHERNGNLQQSKRLTLQSQFMLHVSKEYRFFRTSRGEHTFCAKIGNIWSVITHICCFLALISSIFRFTTRNPKEPEYIVSALTASVLRRARNLLPNHPLRTLDAIQLASATEVRIQLNTALTFLSSDKRLLGAAAREGFLVDDPQNYP